MAKRKKTATYIPPPVLTSDERWKVFLVDQDGVPFKAAYLGNGVDEKEAIRLSNGLVAPSKPIKEEET